MVKIVSKLDRITQIWSISVFNNNKNTHTTLIICNLKINY